MITVWQTRPVYEGGLTKAAKVMKLASVASLVGASAAVPFFFTGDSTVPSAARTILALTTIGMTGASTGIVAWALRPYITSLNIAFMDAEKGSEEVNANTPLLIETMTLLARPRVRLVFPGQLEPASQPMSSWCVEQPSIELADRTKVILEQINRGRKIQVTAAQPGDLFYAHTEGELSSEMQQIIAVASSPVQPSQ
ncbi:hypothetical protein IWW50_000398 [Coemansia erecta]|nr:hypothetical protein IWW50_000398 [Coemansia erecta]